MDLKTLARCGPMRRPRPWRGCIIGVCALLGTASPPALASDWPLMVPAVASDELRFVVERRDVTALLQEVSPSRYAPRAEAQLDASQLQVYRVDDAADWVQIAGPQIDIVAPENTLPLVEDDYGLPQLGEQPMFEPEPASSGSWTPALTVGVDTQIDEGISGDGFASQRKTFQDLSLSGGFAGSQQWGPVELGLQSDWVGGSHKPNALRYFEMGSQAPKLDLSQYQLSLNVGSFGLALGHVNAGNHELLISGLNTRGISLSYAPFSRLRFSGGRLNSVPVTGYNRLLGYSQREQQVYTFGIEVDVLQASWANLSLGLSWMDGQKLSQAGFDTGEITDAEKNDGYGLTLRLGLLNQRINLEGLWARSRYDAAPDPFLQQGDELVAIDATRDAAWQARLNVSAIQGWDSPLGLLRLDLSANQGRVDPLYRTLAAFASADQDLRGWGANFGLGALSGSINQNRSEDNVDNLPSILKTRSENTAVTLNLPLNQLWSSQSWLPSLDFNWGHNTQKALNSPKTEDSGFNTDSHLPDQKNLQRGFNMNWALGDWTVGGGWSRANQDNRQGGREQADFVLRQRSLNLGWQALSVLSLNAGLNETRQRDVEQGNENRSFNWNFGASLYTSFGLALNAQYGRNRNFDILDIARDTSQDVSADLSWSGDLGEWVPSVQIVLRYARNRSESINREFDSASRQGTWRWTGGVNMTVF